MTIYNYFVIGLKNFRENAHNYFDSSKIKTLKGQFTF